MCVCRDGALTSARGRAAGRGRLPRPPQRRAKGGTLAHAAHPGARSAEGAAQGAAAGPAPPATTRVLGAHARRLWRLHGQEKRASNATTQGAKGARFAALAVPDTTPAASARPRGASEVEKQRESTRGGRRGARRALPRPAGGRGTRAPRAAKGGEGRIGERARPCSGVPLSVMCARRPSLQAQPPALASEAGPSPQIYVFKLRSCKRCGGPRAGFTRVAEGAAPRALWAGAGTAERAWAGGWAAPPPSARRPSKGKGTGCAARRRRFKAACCRLVFNWAMFKLIGRGCLQARPNGAVPKDSRAERASGFCGSAGAKGPRSPPNGER
ncbi:MAG: hypothetical protein J3K34DRAFT_426230 [Monoraphidium minutum]|nr:MAG: hypothetical protein J3K34DRAFT_426230 [Monoraphidium minutum]